MNVKEKAIGRLYPEIFNNVELHSGQQKVILSELAWVKLCNYLEDKNLPKEIQSILTCILIQTENP